MNKTLPLDMMLSLGVGMAFSLAQGEVEIEKRSVFSSTYFLAGLVFQAVAVFGIALLCFGLYPDWMLMYFAPRGNVPNAIIVYVFVGYFAMYVLGFLAVPALRRLRDGLQLAAFGALLVLIFLFIGLTFHRLWYVGGYAAYLAGVAPAMTGTSLFWILLASMPVVIAGLLLVLYLLRSHLGVGSELEGTA